MFFIFFSICIAAKHGSGTGGTRRHSSGKKTPVKQESEYFNAFAEDEPEQSQQKEQAKKKDYSYQTKKTEKSDKNDWNFENKKIKQNNKPVTTKKGNTNVGFDDEPINDEKYKDFNFEYPEKPPKAKKDDDSGIPDDWFIDDNFDSEKENPSKRQKPIEKPQKYQKPIEKPKINEKQTVPKKQQPVAHQTKIEKTKVEARNSEQPKILLISSDSFTLFHKRKANVTVEFNKDPLDAYCRIDDQIKRGIVYDRSMVICSLPSSILPDQAFISVSFDLKNWSPPEVINTYPSSWMVGVAFAAVLIAIMFIRTYIANRPRHKPKGFTPEKFLPLSARQMPNMFVADALDVEHGKQNSNFQVENQVQADFESQQLNNDSQPAYGVSYA